VSRLFPLGKEVPVSGGVLASILSQSYILESLSIFVSILEMYLDDFEIGEAIPCEPSVLSVCLYVAFQFGVTSQGQTPFSGNLRVVPVPSGWYMVDSRDVVIGLCSSHFVLVCCQSCFVDLE